MCHLMIAKVLPYLPPHEKIRTLVSRPSQNGGRRGLKTAFVSKKPQAHSKFDKFLRVTYVNSNKSRFSQIVKDGRS